MRRPVRNRSVEEDPKWLKWVLSWGSKWQTKEGHYLMRESPDAGESSEGLRHPD